MARSSVRLDVYLEIGQKRIFAGAVDWLGWCRAGRDEDSALRALLDYCPRYAHALRRTRLGFHAPADIDAFTVTERLKGDATTDFGAPDATPSSDAQPVDEAELRRLQMLLKACWRALDEAAAKAEGKELRKGPRGGGRDLPDILQHAMGSEQPYVTSLGWKIKPDPDESLHQALVRTHQATLDALAAAAHGELPTHGPRGGARWSPRYFVRRVAWHVLDHAWEIEDRAG
jgi:hypothetical protein